MNTDKLILVTGATGKVGQTFIAHVLRDPRFAGFRVRALCHRRRLEAGPRLEVMAGSIENQDVAEQAAQGVTHVLHLATTKETPSSVMDVAVKGLFWLLEACRASPAFKQFVLVGGDASVGHFFYPHTLPVVESQEHSAYPGCYALSKVLEETMLTQYYRQYDLNGCCLRTPWIMEKDDLRYSLSFGDDVFGGPRWCDMVGKEAAARYQRIHAVPIMLDAQGAPVQRNFVHVDDLVEAISLAIDHPKARQQLFNVCMNEPLDYGRLGAYLHNSRGLPTVEISTPYHSTWLDNSKIKFILGWRPAYDLERLVDAAWSYERTPDDPRVVHYPG